MLFELHIFVDVESREQLERILNGMIEVAGDQFVSATGAEVDDEIVDAEDATT